MHCDCHVPVPAAAVPDRGAWGSLRRVLVETCGLGTQRQALVRALGSRTANLRAVAWADRHSTGADLQALHALGVRAARLAPAPRRDPGSLLEAEMVCARLPDGWHVEVAGDLADAQRLAGVLSRLGRTVVMEVPAAAWAGPTPAQLATLRWWLEMGNLHLKLLSDSSKLPAPHGSAPLPGPLIAAFPDRFLWGRGSLDAPVDENLRNLLDATAARLYAFQD
jgi:hypothetical protein